MKSISILLRNPAWKNNFCANSTQFQSLINKSPAVFAHSTAATPSNNEKGTWKYRPDSIWKKLCFSYFSQQRLHDGSWNLLSKRFNFNPNNAQGVRKLAWSYCICSSTVSAVFFRQKHWLCSSSIGKIYDWTAMAKTVYFSRIGCWRSRYGWRNVSTHEIIT